MELAFPPSISVCQKASKRSKPTIFGSKRNGFPSLKLKMEPVYGRSLQIFHSPLTQRSLASSGNKAFSMVAYSSKSPGSGEEDNAAPNPVLNLYAALKNINLEELSGVIGENCRLLSSFSSILRPFEGKKQVLEFFSYLMGIMGKRMSFVIEPTQEGGMNVGISWSINGEKAHGPLGNGLSFYGFHHYEGKVLIRDVHTILPTFPSLPLPLNCLLGLLTPTLEKIFPPKIFESKGMKAFTYCFLTLIFTMTLLMVLRRSRV